MSGFPGASRPSAPQPELSPDQTVTLLLKQYSPAQLVKSFVSGAPHQRDLNVLYGLFRRWMATNCHSAIQLLADNFLLGHFSDSLLLRGGWQENKECLVILWQEHVDFANNWPGDRGLVTEFLQPAPTLLTAMQEMKVTEPATPAPAAPSSAMD